MTNTMLVDALCGAIEDGFDRVSDRMIRVEIQQGGIPFAQVVERLRRANRDLAVVSLDPDVSEALQAAGIQHEVGAQIATSLRNKIGDKPDVMCIGKPNAAEGGSGLADLKVVIDVATLVQFWRREIDNYLLELSDEGDSGERVFVARVDACNHLLDLAEERKLTVKKLDDYFTSWCITPPGPSEDYQNLLWKLEMLPDEKLTGSAEPQKRLRENRSLIAAMRSSDEVALRNKELLETSQKATVKNFLGYLDNRDAELLAQSNFEDVRSALGEAAPPPPGETPKHKSLLRFLGAPDGKVDLAELIGKVGEQVDARIEISEWGVGSLSYPLADPIALDIKINGARADKSPWFSGVYEEIEQSKQILGLIEKDEEDGVRSRPQELTVKYFDDLLAELPEEMTAYLGSRKDILEYQTKLESSDRDCLELLVVAPSVLAAAENYVEKWKALLRAFVDSQFDDEDLRRQLGTLLSLLDGHWRSPYDGTGDHASIAMDQQFTDLEMAAFHPWRLDPLVRMTKEIKERAAGPNQEGLSQARVASELVTRAVPSFRIFVVGDSELTWVGSDKGKNQFQKVPEESLSSLESDVDALTSVVKSYARAHPWAQGGSAMMVVNPPNGGLLGKSRKALSDATGSNPFLEVVCDRDTIGVDREVSLPEDSRISHVPNLDQWLNQHQMERDITLMFLPSQTNARPGVRGGSHGSIAVSFKRGHKLENGWSFSPTLAIGHESSNEVITLVHDLAGNAKSHTISQSLSISEPHLKLATRVASGTAWLVVAAQSTVSQFQLTTQEGLEMHSLESFDDGPYRFFIFARDVEPLSEFIKKDIDALPNPPGMAELRDLLKSLTKKIPSKLTDLTNERFGVTEALGLFNAQRLAGEFLDRDPSTSSEDLRLVLSLDDATWTKGLFNSDDQRADLLVVQISAEENAQYPIRFMVVEAKCKSKEEYLDPCLDHAHFFEAITQTESTKRQLERVIGEAGQGRLIEQLQFRSLVEQIASQAAAEYEASLDKDEAQSRFEKYFEHISNLLPSGTDGASGPVEFPEIQRLVAVTYLKGYENTRYMSSGDDLVVVSASYKLLERLIKDLDNRGNDEAIELHKVELLETVDLDQGNEEPGVQSLGAEEKLDAAVEIDQSLTEESDQSSSDLSEGIASSLLPLLRKRSSHVDGRVELTEVSVGPTFVTVDVPFAQGGSVKPLQTAAPDIARDFGTEEIEISNSPTQGRITISVARSKRSFPELPGDSVNPVTEDAYLPFRVGLDRYGNPVEAPVSLWPHALVAGTTGSGKTVFLRSMLKQLDQWGPDIAQVAIVDGKGDGDFLGVVDDAMFIERFPEPLDSADKATDVLQWLMDEEVPARKEIIQGFYEKTGRRASAPQEYIRAVSNGSKPEISPLIIFIDEFNELMLRGGKHKAAFADAVTSVAQTGRSRLIHLVLATQRPSKDVVSGDIKANIQTRFAFRLPAAPDSLTVLGHGNAERLLGKGDFYMQLNGGLDVRLQSYNVP